MKPERDDDSNMREHLLQRVKIAIPLRIPGHDIRDWDIDAVVDFITQNLVLRMRVYLATIERNRIEVKYPRDWWQAFRERWFPKWWLERHPVEYVLIDQKLFGNVCPHINLPEMSREHIDWILQGEQHD